MVAHEKRNSAQLFCAVPTRNDLALSSLLFSAHPTQKLGYPRLHLIYLLVAGGSNYRAPQKTDEPWPCAVWRKMRWDLWEMRLEIWEIVLYTGVTS